MHSVLKRAKSLGVSDRGFNHLNLSVYHAHLNRLGSHVILVNDGRRPLR